MPTPGPRPDGTNASTRIALATHLAPGLHHGNIGPHAECDVRPTSPPTPLSSRFKVFATCVKLQPHAPPTKPQIPQTSMPCNDNHSFHHPQMCTENHAQQHHPCTQEQHMWGPNAPVNDGNPRTLSPCIHHTCTAPSSSCSVEVGRAARGTVPWKSTTNCNRKQPLGSLLPSANSLPLGRHRGVWRSSVQPPASMGKVCIVQIEGRADFF